MNQQELKHLLYFDPGTGLFRWRRSPKNGMQPWDIAGKIDHQGYAVITIDGKGYMAHRLAWLYVYAELPAQIDHKNMVRSDNRIGNLRAADNAQNGMNKRMQSNNTSGFKGVTFHKRTGRFHAKIQANGQRKSLGYHVSAELAHKAYLKAAGELHGEFSRIE